MKSNMAPLQTGVPPNEIVCSRWGWHAPGGPGCWSSVSGTILSFVEGSKVDLMPFPGGDGFENNDFTGKSGIGLPQSRKLTHSSLFVFKMLLKVRQLQFVRICTCVYNILIIKYNKIHNLFWWLFQETGAYWNGWIFLVDNTRMNA